ncbi:endonuclease V [Pedobacter psychrotolerans]|uniref:Endonuclease V n=1 Tax=Pedobacter psychrotolerans TaxID=1843235 RepID=A0A4V2RY84_9SPHI|nr:endonuclease V [Pedobacter psychrotolerans]TCO18259.1 endonuclease V [Pedobacter psychrotolerans]GGE70973.1 endonuclease V [Pedobacter psychrotolerans]
MILALDVHYKDDGSAKSVGVLFNLKDSQPKEILVAYLEETDEYIPGEFYKRELLCLLKIVEKVSMHDLEAIVIDGYVYIDNEKRFGLGGYLWQTLNEQIPIIGVAKNFYHGNNETVKQIYRGKSKKPLYISSVGLELDTASDFITQMPGEFRIPHLLKQLDTITKEK